MEVTIQRTSADKIVDMYIVYFSPPRQRFVCFTRKQFEELFPEAKLERGEKKVFKMYLTKPESGV